MAGAHVFVDDLERPTLSVSDRHHLERVLRLRTGDEITVSDGAGRWRRCRFDAELAALDDVSAAPRPAPEIAVGFALAKGERPEWTVQKLTELGVDRIVPIAAARSVVRWTGDRAAMQVERLRRVAREAASQCRRVWLPEVEAVQAFEAVVGHPGAALAHPGGVHPTLDHPFVLTGPEGGWSEEELTRAAAAGAPQVTLGPHVLRAETAAIAAAALLCGLRAGVVAPHHS